MQPRLEKSRPTGQVIKSTAGAEARNTSEMSAKMHFYAVHNAGDQLRWAKGQQTDRKPDRMVGR